MNISIGNDHAATAYKFEIIKLLESKGIVVKNYGTRLMDLFKPKKCGFLFRLV